MLYKGNNDYEIEHFGLKLMTSSKSQNKIPDFYLALAQNARLYDTGIGPRRGKELFIKCDEVGFNNGAFVLDDILYQIASSKIYRINEDKTRTFIVDTSFKKRVNAITYDISSYSKFAILSSPGERIKIFDGKTLIEARDTLIEARFSSYNQKYSENTLFVGKDKESNTSSTGFVHIHDVYRKNFVGGIASGKLGEGYTIEDNDGKKIATNIYDLKTSYVDGGNVENIFGHFFTYRKNILYMSQKIDTNDSNSIFDFVARNTKRVYFDSDIVAIKSTMSGLYIFTEKDVNYISKGSIRYNSDSSIAEVDYSILGESGAPINCFLLVSAGDKVIYLSKGLNISQISYMEGTSTPGIGDISTKANAGIKSLLDNIDENQDSGFAFYNERERTVQFQLRTKGSSYNDICFIYDLVNETWAVDTNRNYNSIIKYKNELYGFSSKDTNIYIDDKGYTDSNQAIDFKILTQALNFETEKDKFFSGFFLSGGIDINTSLKIKAYIDLEEYFEETYSGIEAKNDDIKNTEDITNSSLFPNIDKKNTLNSFNLRAEEGSINKFGEKIMIEISSNSIKQNFIIDKLGIIKMDSNFNKEENKI